MAIELTTENYGEIAASKLPVLIDFGAEWCGPCRMVAPIVEESAGEYRRGRVLICTCDAEKSDDIVATYKVRNIPTLVFLKEGQEVAEQSWVRRRPRRRSSTNCRNCSER